MRVKRLIKTLLALSLSILMILSSTYIPMQVNAVPNDKQGATQDSETTRLIVKYKNDNGRVEVHNALKDKLKSVKATKNGKYDVITIKGKAKHEDILNDLKSKNAHANIEYIHPDYEINLSSNDTYFNNQWGLYDNTTVQQSVYRSVYDGNSIGANVVPAWEKTMGEGVTVAVIDTGIDITHEDLQGSIFTNSKEIINGKDDDSDGYIDDITGWNFIDDNNTVHSQLEINDEQHGTHIAGIIAAQVNNSKGIAGVAPNAKILPLKVFKNGTAYTSDIIDAIDYATKMGVKVINCSWGTTQDNPALKEAIENTSALFICAAGNSGVNIDTKPVYPASYTSNNIITVASINKSGNLATTSNYGEVSVNVAAPGEDILSTLPNNQYGLKSGTSMAAAFVSGEVALIENQNSNINMSELRDKILNTSDKITMLTGKVYCGNKINAGNAVNNVTPVGSVQISQKQNGLDVNSVDETVINAVYQQNITFSMFLVQSKVVNPQNGHSYAVIDNSMTWQEAKAYCEGLGGHLLTITSQGEQNFVNSILPSGMKQYYFIGGNQPDGSPEPGDGWRWVSGEAMSYTNWIPSQPDNWSNDNVIMMIKDKDWAGNTVTGKWIDDINSAWFGVQSYGFICEWDFNRVVNPQNGHSYAVIE